MIFSQFSALAKANLVKFLTDLFEKLHLPLDFLPFDVALTVALNNVALC